MKSVLKNSKRFSLVSFLFVLVSGCVTKVKTTNTENLAQIQPEATGFLLAYDFQVEDQMVGQDGCTAVFKNVSEHDKIQIDLKYGKEFVLAETKPGIYYLHDFYCGRYHWDLTDITWAQFHVEQNKVSLIAPLKFKITDTKRISVKASNRKNTYQKVSAIWGLLNDETKKLLISGYTLTPITATLIRNNESWGNREISFNGKDFENIKKRKYVNFKSCYAGEGKVNGLWLGQLKVDIDYQGDQVSSIKFENDNHTFSNHFIDCVKSEISEFKNKDFHPKKAKIIL